MATLPESYMGAIRPADGPEVKLLRLPLTNPGPGEVLIRNVAVASNPKDWFLPIREKNFSYVQGSDVAGTVVMLGEGAEKLGIELGMRVAAFAKSNDQNSKYGGYAEYTIAPACTTIALPDSVSFESGSTIALCSFTAYIGLFIDLGLSPPSSFGQLGTERSGTEVIIINGASSSIGAYAVQLAKRAGHYVVGVAGSSSEYAKSLGADILVDYRGKSDAQLEEALVQVLRSRSLTTGAALDCVSEGDSSLMLANVLAKVPTPGKRSMVSRLLQPIPGQLEKFPYGVGLTFTYVGEAYGKNSESCRVFARQLTQALAFTPSNSSPFQANRVKLMSRGLADVGEGLELIKAGNIHGEKLVYRIVDTPGI